MPALSEPHHSILANPSVFRRAVIAISPKLRDTNCIVLMAKCRQYQDGSSPGDRAHCDLQLKKTRTYLTVTMPTHPHIAGQIDPISGNTVSVAAYEQELDNDLRFAMSEGERHFEGSSKVHLALRKITKRLNELGIPYAVAGGMALFAHGLRRFTEDVDILVTAEALKQVHEQLDGSGYVRRFPKSKNLRDVDNKVRIEFIVTGQYPGDGKPKPVAFPDPRAVAEERDGVKYVNLQTLVEMKLASGISSSERVKDLGDVQELIKLLNIPQHFGDQLSDYVRGKFDQLWLAAREVPRRFILIWRNKWLTAEAKSIDDMIMHLRDAAAQLAAMKQDGVTLDPQGGTGDDFVYLVTTDPEVARKYGMEDERELWTDDESDED